MFTNKKIYFVLLIPFFISLNIHAQTNNIKLYTFGHSLIDHRPPLIDTPSDETTIMHWIYKLAQHSGKEFSAGGKYGFMPSHAANLPPYSQWGYDVVPSVWDSETESFADADINTIMMTSANFIQYQPSNLPNPLNESTTIVESTETIIDWVNQQKSNVNFYIYENWPEMDLKKAYPPTIPSDSEISSYYTQTLGSFKDWWIEYQDFLLDSRPDSKIRLIPVGTVMTKILTTVIPGQVPFNELYEDSSPHGRASLYFLAGMITYMSIYGENVPDSYIPESIIHDGIRSNFITIKDFAWNELLNFNTDLGQSRVFIQKLVQNNNLNVNDDVKIVPLVGKNIFSISGIQNNVNWIVYNSLGRRIKSGFSHKIDLSKQSRGLFFVKIEGNDGFVKKLVLE